MAALAHSVNEHNRKIGTNERLRSCLRRVEHNDSGHAPCLQTAYVIFWRLAERVGRQEQIIACRNCLSLDVFQHAQIEVTRRLTEVRKRQFLSFRKERDGNYPRTLAHQTL